MHSRTVCLHLRLWHKCRVQPVPFGDRFDHHLKSHQIIRRHKCFVIPEIDLMLSGGDLVMGGNDLKSHIFQRQDHISPGVFSQVKRTYIKISALLMGQRCGHPVFVRMKKEKFTFRSHIHGVSHFFRAGDLFLQDMPRIHLIRCPVFPVYITDKPCNLSLLGSPRKDLKCAQVRVKIHIRVFLPRKPFQRRNIKHTSVIHRLLKLAHSYSHIFHRSEDIRKLETYKFYIFLLYDPEDIFFRIFLHRSKPPFHPLPDSSAPPVQYSFRIRSQYNTKGRSPPRGNALVSSLL